MSDIPPVAPGQPVSAGHTNRIVEELDRVRPLAGRGLVVTRGPGGSIIGLAGGGFERWVDSVITDVQGAEGDLVEAVTYSARPRGASDEAELLAVTPRYGRVFARGVACVPAAVGDACFIVRYPGDDGRDSADLAVLSEQYLSRLCGSPKPAPGGAEAEPVRESPRANMGGATSVLGSANAGTPSGEA